MDFIIEILFEILVEGCFTLTEEKKVPILLRFICGFILALLYGGLIGLLFYIAIIDNSIFFFIFALVIAVFVLVTFIYKYKKLKNKEKNH